MFERNPLTVDNQVDENGNPTGGFASGVGLSIAWQDGPLGRNPPAEPNGAFVDDVIEAAGGKFACRENALAITKLEEAMHWLYARRQAREARGVQGLHQP